MIRKDKHKDCRKYCKKCGAVLGQNVDGKPICFCEAWPGNSVEPFTPMVHKPLSWLKECEKKLGNTTNVKVIK